MIQHSTTIVNRTLLQTAQLTEAQGISQIVGSRIVTRTSKPSLTSCRTLTASLSSKMYNWDSPWEECVLVGTWSTSLNWSIFLEGQRNEGCQCGWKCGWIHPHLTIDQPLSFFCHLISWLWHRASFPGAIWTVSLVERRTSIAMSQRSRASNPPIRSRASRDMISDSVELCETELCFLHIQLVGTNVLLPKIHKTPPEVDLESSKVPQSLSLGMNPIYSAVPCFPHDNSRKSFVWWM